MASGDGEWGFPVLPEEGNTGDEMEKMHVQYTMTNSIFLLCKFIGGITLQAFIEKCEG